MLKLGLVTHNMARDWDTDTLIRMCEATGFQGVELRTTHAHGVELTLSPSERLRVRERFADSRVQLVGLGTVCEYHAVDPAEVKSNIGTTIGFLKLAADLGAIGVKVRPNGFQDKAGIPREKTIEQIGRALRKCAEAAQDFGQEIWLEVHGPETSRPEYIRQMMEVVNHPSVGACWNSVPSEVENGSVARSFATLRPFIRWCHIRDLTSPYPWRQLFALLRDAGYERYTLAEIPGSSDPLRVMSYYARLWREMAGTCEGPA